MKVDIQLKAFYLLKKSFIFLILLISQNQYGQKKLLNECQKLYKENKFKELVPLINKVVKNSETKNSSFAFNRKQTVDLLIFNESFDFISFPIFLPCNKKLQEHWVIKLNIQTIK